MKLMLMRRSGRGRRNACRKGWWCPGVRNVCVQRGVQLRSEDDAADDADRTEQMQEKASV
ncbi:hypothetical protein ECP03047777_5131 [Escherichia coli P0304777.7]|nr:hypothetical protein ECP03047777_5131 [Escherichia coli P0304777.7]